MLNSNATPHVALNDYIKTPNGPVPPGAFAVRSRPPLPFDPSMIDDLMVIERPDRLPRIALWYSVGALTPPQLNALLGEWWTGAEFQGVGTRLLIDMFRYAGFVTDTEGVVVPTEPLILYRGAGIQNPRGFSWTTDEAVAAWFARRTLLLFPDQRPRLFTANVAPKHVLGIFHGRNESEVVINPLCLRGRLQFGSGIPATDDRIVRLADDLTRRRVR